MSKTTHMQLIEARDPQGRDIRAILRQAYQQAGTYDGAGKALGLRGPTVYRWMRDLGLHVEKRVARRAAGVAP